MPLVLKLVGNTWENASRDKRELSVYKELGYDVLVMAKGGEKDRGRQETVDGYTMLRYSTRPLGLKAPTSFNRFIALFTWAHYVSRIKADVITAHDLRPGLIIAWMSTWYQRKKPKLVYDSHEFELGRDYAGARSRFASFLIAKTEKFLMKRCAFSIMVNDSIADEVQKIHKLKERPVVVRNTPNYWTIHPELCAQTRKQLLEQFAAGKESIHFLTMYHGGVRKNGIELIIESLPELPGVGLVILGNGQAGYLSELHRFAIQNGVDDRVMFHPAVSLSELSNYIGAVEVDIAPVEVTAKNALYSLPNKFFESIQSLTPVITSDVPEMKRIIDAYQIGLTFERSNVEALTECIRKMKSDQAFYHSCKDNLKAAKETLCWEQEKTVLKKAIIEKIGPIVN